MDSKLIDKIKKLIALSDSPNEHEAQSALLKAQLLMAKHNVDMADVQGSNLLEEAVIFGEMMDTVYTDSYWKLNLANVIAENFRCYGFGRKSTQTIIFLGKPSDTTICQIMFSYAVGAIEYVCSNISKDLRENGFSTDGVAMEYATGFIEGLRDKFKRQRDESKEFEIALRIPNDVTDAFNTLRNTVKHPAQEGDKESLVYLQGFKDGLSFEMNRLKE